MYIAARCGREERRFVALDNKPLKYALPWLSDAFRLDVRSIVLQSKGQPLNMELTPTFLGLSPDHALDVTTVDLAKVAADHLALHDQIKKLQMALLQEREARSADNQGFLSVLSGVRNENATLKQVLTRDKSSR